MNCLETETEEEQISITLTEYREENTTVYVADIVLSSSKYLKTDFAQNSYGKNVTEKTSEMAAQKNAILAINGDYYGAQEKEYVLRNGTVYRSLGLHLIFIMYLLFQMVVQKKVKVCHF